MNTVASGLEFLHVEQVAGDSGAEKMAFCYRYRGGYMRNRCAYRKR